MSHHNGTCTKRTGILCDMNLENNNVPAVSKQTNMHLSVNIYLNITAQPHYKQHTFYLILNIKVKGILLFYQLLRI